MSNVNQPPLAGIPALGAFYANSGTRISYYANPTWQAKPLKRWNGSEWVPAKALRWNGSAWVQTA